MTTQEIQHHQEEIKSQAEEILGQNYALATQKQALEKAYEDLVEKIEKEIADQKRYFYIYSIIDQK